MAALGLLSSEEAMVSQIAAAHGLQGSGASVTPVFLSASLFLGTSLLLVVCCCLFAADSDRLETVYIRKRDGTVETYAGGRMLQRRPASGMEQSPGNGRSPPVPSTGDAVAGGTVQASSVGSAVPASRVTLPASACASPPRQAPQENMRAAWGLAALDGLDVSRMMSPDLSRMVTPEASRLNLHPGDPGIPSPAASPTNRGTGPACDTPPSLCSVLTLQHCDAWFSVPLEQLVEGSPGFQIFGLTGRPLLKATFAGTGEGPRSFSISMIMERSPVIGSVHAPLRTSTGSLAEAAAPLEVRGVGGQLYGFLERASSGGYSLRHESGPVLTMEVNASNKHLFVTSLLGRGGRVLACSARCRESEFFSGVDHLQVCVNPGVDALLILCSVIGALTFGDGFNLVPGTPLNFVHS